MGVGLRYGGRNFGSANCTCISGNEACGRNHERTLPRTSVSRRNFLSRSAASLGLATLAAPAGAPFALAQTEKPRLIDVHYHIAPPAWSAALSTRNELRGVWEHWSVAKAIEDMDRDGVERAMTSITTPGVRFAGTDAVRLARECNEFAAKMRSDHPRRFGMFAVLPLPDIDASLAEIAYAMDTLKADGIGLLTSYGDKWLGHPAFDPVFAELNRRKVLIYTHPTEANCCRNLLPGVPSAVIEYGTDTSRAITEIVFGGTAKRYPDMRIIFSHAGGTLPFLVERVMFLERMQGASLKPPKGGAVAALRNFYYDTAQAAMAAPMAALRQVAPLSHILYGTDYPYRTAGETFSELAQSHMFTAAELPAVERGNALALLPQFAG